MFTVFIIILYISRIRRNLFIHIARIPIGDSPRVHPNILKCSLHSPVAKGIRLVVFATRVMVCDTPTHYLILNSLASARGRVILHSHFLILLLLIILISLYIGLEELQQFQHVDNVVELQLQPVSPAPPSTTVSVDTSFFDKVNTVMENFNKFMPFLSQLGSDRRSPTAGPSDIVIPNPVARVPGTAPQGPDAAPQRPDVAPGPSSASLEPRASCSGLHHRNDKVSNPRGQTDKGDQPSGSRLASQPPSPSHQERLRDQLEDVHRQLSHTREIVDFYRAHGRVPPDQSQDDLENLQAQYAQISIALEESVYVASSHRRGPSPASSFHRVASPSGAAPLGPHSSSSLRGSRRSERPRSPSHDRSRSRDAFSGHPCPSRRSHERYEERAVPSDAPAHRRRPRDRESPSCRHLDFPSKSPSPCQKRFASQGSHSSSRERFASRGSSSPKRRHVAPDAPFQERFASRRSPSSPQERFASRRSPASSQERFARGASPQRGHPHPSEWDSLQKQGLAPPGDPFLGSHVLQGHTPPGIPPLQREVPLPLNDDAMSRGTQSLLITVTHLELRVESLLKGDPIQDLLLTTLPRLHGRRRKLMRPLCHRRLRLWLTLS